MSRSYKHNLVRKDGYGSKGKVFAKNQANRRIRHSPDVPNGGKYRLFTDSWNICDFSFRYDPESHYYWRRGELVEYGPDPLWKWKRK